MDAVFVIVDMLNDFIRPDGKLYFEKAQGVVKPIVHLKQAFRGAGVPVVYTNDAHPEASREFEVWPPHCLVGSWGAQIINELPAQSGDILLHKDDLTLFSSSWGERVLRGFGASKLYMAGVATEYCVQACAIDAVRHGFSVTVLSDAIASVDLTAGDGARALETMQQAGVQFTNCAALAL